MYRVVVTLLVLSCCSLPIRGGFYTCPDPTSTIPVSITDASVEIIGCAFRGSVTIQNTKTLRIRDSTFSASLTVTSLAPAFDVFIDKTAFVALSFQSITLGGPSRVTVEGCTITGGMIFQSISGSHSLNVTIDNSIIATTTNHAVRVENTHFSGQGSVLCISGSMISGALAGLLLLNAQSRVSTTPPLFVGDAMSNGASLILRDSVISGGWRSVSTADRSNVYRSRISGGSVVINNVSFRGGDTAAGAAVHMINGAILNVSAGQDLHNFELHGDTTAVLLVLREPLRAQRLTLSSFLLRVAGNPPRLVLDLHISFTSSNLRLTDGLALDVNPRGQLTVTVAGLLAAKGSGIILYGRLNSVAVSAALSENSFVRIENVTSSGFVQLPTLAIQGSSFVRVVNVTAGAIQSSTATIQDSSYLRIENVTTAGIVQLSAVAIQRSSHIAIERTSVGTSLSLSTVTIQVASFAIVRQVDIRSEMQLSEMRIDTNCTMSVSDSSVLGALSVMSAQLLGVAVLQLHALQLRNIAVESSTVRDGGRVLLSDLNVQVTIPGSHAVRVENTHFSGQGSVLCISGSMISGAWTGLLLLNAQSRVSTTPPLFIGDAMSNGASLILRDSVISGGWRSVSTADRSNVYRSRISGGSVVINNVSRLVNVVVSVVSSTSGVPLLEVSDVAGDVGQLCCDDVCRQFNVSHRLAECRSGVVSPSSAISPIIEGICVLRTLSVPRVALSTPMAVEPTSFALEPPCAACCRLVLHLLLPTDGAVRDPSVSTTPEEKITRSEGRSLALTEHRSHAWSGFSESHSDTVPRQTALVHLFTGSVTMSRAHSVSMTPRVIPVEQSPATISPPPVNSTRQPFSRVSLEIVLPAAAATTVAAVGTSSALFGSVAAPTAAGSATRSAAVLRTLECAVAPEDSDPAFVDMPLQFALGSGHFATYAGSLLLTTAILVALPAAVLHGLWWRLRRELSSVAAGRPQLQALKLAGIVHAVSLQYFVPNCAAVSSLLVVHGDGLERGVAIASMLVCVAVVVGVLVPLWSHDGEPEEPQPAALEAPMLETSHADATVDSDCEDESREPVHRHSTGRIAHTDVALHALIDATTKLQSRWTRLYAFEELLFSVVAAVVTSVRLGGCAAIAIIVVVLCVAHGGYLLWWRPYAERFDTFFAGFQLALQLTLALLVAYVVASGTPEQFPLVMQGIGAVSVCIFASFFVQSIASFVVHHVEKLRKHLTEQLLSDDSEGNLVDDESTREKTCDNRKVVLNNPLGDIDL